MSMKTLKSQLKGAKRDEFVLGTVIRWTSGGVYTYAALKTPNGWFTTAQAHNVYVPQRVTFETLLEILARSESSDVEVATEWTDPSSGTARGPVRRVAGPDA